MDAQLLRRLSCPVRACGAELIIVDRALRCPANHSFDLARSGYCNLLQPQDRRAKDPGDAREAVLARARTLDRGVGDAVQPLLVELVASHAAPLPVFLDVGCGTGFFTRALLRAQPSLAFGVDLSRSAIELAARGPQEERVMWIVANADRRLPFVDAAFDVALSITGPKHAAEMHRIVRPGGLVIVATPGPDDLVELREVMLGGSKEVDRLPRIHEMFADGFTLIAAETASGKRRYDPAGIRDILASTYRGARHRERARIEDIDALEITTSTTVIAFRRV